jgi:hypothetical protein
MSALPLIATMKADMLHFPAFSVCQPPWSADRYSAATRCTCHCAMSARSEAGLTGLLRTCAPPVRASSRMRAERSAVMEQR